ncbi:MAG TPA: DUF998 domain-containing protein [Nitrolancea sp.]|nr:DUF998 domain-containing protein [Nitrolancea sp.]
MIAVRQTLRRTLERHPTVVKVLLGCGVIASAWWVAADVIASLRYPGYSYLDQTVSELSAEGAPTRAFLMAVNAVPFAALLAAFGLGVWALSRARAGRVIGGLLAGSAVVGLLGGILFPMMMRGAEGDLRNAMHAPYGAVSMLLFVLMFGFGAKLLGTRFRYYTYGTIAVWFVFGVLMALQSGRMVADEPTPWMGLEERISVYATMLWFAVLSVGLLRTEAAGGSRSPGQPAAVPPTKQPDRGKLPA